MTLNVEQRFERLSRRKLPSNPLPRILPAVCSLLLPGCGQILQRRLPMALVHFIAAVLLWSFWLGWLIHLWSCLDAAWMANQYGELIEQEWSDLNMGRQHKLD